jgi:hypothetical protein
MSKLILSPRWEELEAERVKREMAQAALREIIAGEDAGIAMRPRTPEEAVKAARRVTDAISHARTLVP